MQGMNTKLGEGLSRTRQDRNKSYVSEKHGKVVLRKVEKLKF